MIRLTKEQIKLLHSHLIAETGGTDGIRDDALLDSAISARPLAKKKHIPQSSKRLQGLDTALL